MKLAFALVVLVFSGLVYADQPNQRGVIRPVPVQGLAQGFVPHPALINLVIRLNAGEIVPGVQNIRRDQRLGSITSMTYQGITYQITYNPRAEIVRFERLGQQAIVAPPAVNLVLQPRRDADQREPQTSYGPVNGAESGS